MYEDSWYSFVSEVHGKQDDRHLQRSQHRGRESLLKQANDVDSVAVGASDPLANLLEESNNVRSPPTATVARRAKSYSDFYNVVRAHIRKNWKDVAEVARERTALEGSTQIGSTFEDMYEACEDELLDASQEEFHIYGDQLALSTRHLDGLLRDASVALDLLSSLSGSFKSVEAQTTAFQAQCEDVLAEQKHLKLLSNEVADGLQYYAYLEPITRRLNAPSASSVIGDEGFVQMMTNLDACIKYMIRHPEHRESDIYLTRYQSLLARVLVLIGNMFAKSIQSAAAAAKAAEEERRKITGNVTVTSIYLFQSPKSDTEVHLIKESIRYILTQASMAVNWSIRENRLKANSQAERTASSEYLSLYERQLDALVETYIKSRSSAISDLVERLLTRTIAVDINPDTEFDSYARECITSTLDICASEHSKFVVVFWGASDLSKELEEPTPIRLCIEKGKFKVYLFELATLVYNILQAKLQALHVSSIVDLAMWLNQRSYYQLSSDEVVSSHSDEEEDEMTQETSVKARAKVAGYVNSMITQLAFGLIRERLLKEVERYTAKSSDLAFATPQTNAENIDSAKSGLQLSNQQTHSKEFDGKFMGDPVGARLEKALGPGILEVYRPVGVACRLLLHVHDLTFEYGGENGSSEVAYEIIHQACSAVRRAAEQITLKFSKIDGQIFAIKNLVLLKNFVLAYEIAGSRRASALDFTDIWATFAELRNRGGLFDISSYYKLLTSGSLFPKVVESVQDARVELDGLLRQNITMFCEEGASLVQRGSSGGRKGVMTAEEQIKKKLALSHPHEEQLRQTLWEAIQNLVDEKRKLRK